MKTDKEKYKVKKKNNAVGYVIYIIYSCGGLGWLFYL